MANILKRFTDIMSANINAALDKAEDPAKMIDQYLRNLENDLGKVKAETASVMAEENRSKRALEECQAEIDKMQKYAEKSLLAGNENDAKQFLAKKQQLTSSLTELTSTYQSSMDNAAKMRTMHDKLAADIRSLNARRDTIKSMVAVAKTQEKLNQLGNSVNHAQGSMSAFDRMEAKAAKMMDEANAMAALNESESSDSVDDLMKKYDEEPTSVIDDELAALKAKMGL